MPIWIQPEDDKSSNSNVRKSDLVDSKDVWKSESADSIIQTSTTSLNNKFTFVPMNFPSHIEQQYFETIQQLQLNFKLAKNYVQAQRFVSRFEERCLPRLSKLQATYGFVLNPNTNGSRLNNESIDDDTKSTKSSNRMDTIVEEGEQDREEEGEGEGEGK